MFEQLLYLVHFVSYRYVDQGKNPELYTEDCLKRTLNKNEEVKAKIDAYKVFSIYYDYCCIHIYCVQRKNK